MLYCFFCANVTATLSFRRQHLHQGDCGDAASWPSLSVYAAQQEDRMRLRDHFDAYLHQTKRRAARTYPVVRSIEGTVLRL